MGLHRGGNINIKVIEEDLNMPELGGECAVCNLVISVDRNIDSRSEQRFVIHAVIENYCRHWTHDKVDQLEEFIMDALDQLKEGL